MAEGVLEAQKRKFAAQVGKDMTALDALLDDRLIYIHSNGVRETKAEFLAALAQRDYLSLTPEDVTVREFGDMAIVNGTVHIHAGGGRHMVSRVTDVWRNDGGWKNISWQSTIVAPPDR